MKRPLALLVVAWFCLPTLAQDLNVATESGTYAHIMLTVAGAQQLMAKNAVRTASTGPLVYNGGPVILKATTCAIFWVPPTLQTGAATTMTSHYQTVQMNLLKDYAGHSIDNNNTQYYQGPPTYPRLHSEFGGIWRQLC